MPKAMFHTSDSLKPFVIYGGKTDISFMQAAGSFYLSAISCCQTLDAINVSKTQKAKYRALEKYYFTTTVLSSYIGSETDTDL